MKYIQLIIIIVVVVCLLGCAHILAANGVYKSNKTEDFIIINDENISFNIKIDKRTRKMTGEYAYKYTILPDSDGKIYVTLSSREALDGIGQYNYYWNGNAIKMTDKQGKEVNVFYYKDKVE
jgi:hypothetical protein